jgi:hypothetical protein
LSRCSQPSSSSAFCGPGSFIVGVTANPRAA